MPVPMALLPLSLRTLWEAHLSSLSRGTWPWTGMWGPAFGPGYQEVGD